METSSEMPASAEPEPSKSAEDTVTLTPVPPEDIIACAKPKCSLCYGLGKLTIKAVGSETSEVSVCNCAIKRFVNANRGRLAASRDKKLFYKSVPAGLDISAPEKDDSEDSLVSVTGNEDASTSRFRVIKERIVSIDSALAEIAERYDRQIDDLQPALLVAAAELDEQQKGWKGNVEARKIMVASLEGYDRRIAVAEEELLLLREERATTNDLLKATDETLLTMQTSLAPYHRAVDKAKEDVANMEKKKHQALKPGEQRKASLLKRMQHKAASMGLSMEDVDSKLVTPEAS
jgi:hypothetical protein